MFINQKLLIKYPVAMKRYILLFIFQLVFCFGAFSQMSYDSTTIEHYSNDGKTVYKERKGFALEIGLGYGYSSLHSNTSLFDKYGISGFNFNFGMGFYTSPRSRILFNFKSNIFVSEVDELYRKWLDKMSEDNLEAIGVIIASPFLFGFAPLARSHFLFPSIEYTYFLKSEVPSFYFKGCLGVGIIYERIKNASRAGLGLSAGAGYEFTNNFGCHAEVMYTGVEQGYLRAVTLLLGIDFILH